MAVVWIDTVDVATAKQLVQQLVLDFGGENVMLTAVGGEIHLKMEFGSHAVVATALEAIESWLDETGTHAQVSYGSGLSYDGESLAIASRQ